jgi:hypothetical protein
VKEAVPASSGSLQYLQYVRSIQFG